LAYTRHELDRKVEDIMNAKQWAKEQADREFLEEILSDPAMRDVILRDNPDMTVDDRGKIVNRKLYYEWLDSQESEAHYGKQNHGI
jgi:hypothetical protein